MRGVVLLTFLLALACAFDYKNLQGPPSEFGVFTLPPAKDLADVSSGAVLPVRLSSNKQTTVLMHSDHPSFFTFCVMSPISEKPNIFVQAPGTTQFIPVAEALNLFQGTESSQDLVLGQNAEYPSLCFQFKKAPVGTWAAKFQFSGDVPLNTLVGYVVVHSRSPIKVRAYLAEDLLVGQNVNIYADLFMDELLGIENQTKFFTSLEAQADILMPHGQSERVPLTTQQPTSGLFFLSPQDEVAFQGVLSATQAGPYFVKMEVKGVDDQGYPFQRTVEKLIQVDSSTLGLGTEAYVSLDSLPMIEFKIPITGTLNGTEVVAYAEIWSSDFFGVQVPIAWVSGLSSITPGYISLKLHINWISSGQFQLPFVLKNVRIQGTNYFTVLAQADEIPVTVDEALAYSKLFNAKFKASEEEMRNGLRPEKYKIKPWTRSDDPNVKLILLHGYCSDGRPFSEEDFTNFVVFTDPDANRKISEFSKLVLEFVDNQQLDGFALVAHSQGGLVSLNIATYYWSGLDMVEGGRKIQSVGSPYQGTALSGFVSSLASVFGYGCGSNEDLSKDGAKKWLSNIPTEKRALVYYITSEGTDSCSSAADWVGLETPNDGVVAKDFAQLPGGNSMGNMAGFCHVEGLNYPPQCRNHPNNQQMNSNAARTFSSL